MAKITFFGCEDWEHAYFKSHLPDHQVEFYDELEANDSEIISVFVDSHVDKAALSSFPRLKMIAARSTGYDHIDMEVCKRKGIAVTNVPAYGENTVAEHTFGLLLALSKRIYDGMRQIKEDGDFDPSSLRGFDLKGKTIGVVGTGRIGKNVIKIANGFGMKVIAYDTIRDDQAATQLGFQYADKLEQLLAASDVVSLHVPYLKATHHLINSQNIGLMKPSAVLINTSRGAVVETEALVSALRDGKLAGACLDVIEEEDAMKDEMHYLGKKTTDLQSLRNILASHVLMKMPNVIMTPHSAFNTKEALMRIAETTVANIESFLSGRPENLVS
ncbi:hypothetical protein A3F65_02210 [Candidatus Saccharibacteria bacterium RIFCSPHIGHO2_12_FULL_47_16b]|nr:MAG: hypothetical protein A3F65_02210 [Candidatus Saccharibacteria bacterium RIFCSPHIGHO2_12_FULL_47_16b]